MEVLSMVMDQKGPCRKLDLDLVLKSVRNWPC